MEGDQEFDRYGVKHRRALDSVGICWMTGRVTATNLSQDSDSAQHMDACRTLLKPDPQHR